ncbi:MAG: dTDP-4-dehydrorhamnose 3,5-epimerase [Gemmatimonadaceae bacterium]
MEVSETELPGVLLVQPSVHGDERGFFLETFRQVEYAAAGIAGPFVQDNLSRSRRGVLRGLHFQHPHGQGKLVQVLEGEVFDVAVDVRLGSPFLGKWVGQMLSSETKQQLYIPPGFAHGFLVVSAEALFSYKCTEYYDPASELTLRWDDPALGIEWPACDVLVSAKDRAAITLDELQRASMLPHRERDGTRTHR